MVKKLKRPKTDVKPDHLGPTERRWMSHKFADNMLKALTTMAEDNDKAFDILMSVFEVGADRGFHDVVTSLDDMNIRGEQIVLAWNYADLVHAEGDDDATQLDKFMALAEERFPKMIDYINANWKKAFMEKAVPSGAHRWMHKKIAEAPANVG